jgi:hypothetical protein
MCVIDAQMNHGGMMLFLDDSRSNFDVEGSGQRSVHLIK